MRGLSLSILLITLLSNKCDSNKTNFENSSGLTIEQAFRKNIEDTVLTTGWYHTSDTTEGFKRYFEYLRQHFYVDPKPILTKKYIDKYEIRPVNWSDKNEYQILLWLDEEGTGFWADATEKARKKQAHLLFILQDTIVNAPIVMAQMTNGVAPISISDMDKTELEHIIERIKK